MTLTTTTGTVVGVATVLLLVVFAALFYRLGMWVAGVRAEHELVQAVLWARTPLQVLAFYSAYRLPSAILPVTESFADQDATLSALTRTAERLDAHQEPDEARARLAHRRPSRRPMWDWFGDLRARIVAAIAAWPRRLADDGDLGALPETTEDDLVEFTTELRDTEPAAVDGETQRRLNDPTFDWAHEDGSRCTAGHLMDRAFANAENRTRWWCTEHQAYLTAIPRGAVLDHEEDLFAGEVT